MRMCSRGGTPKLPRMYSFLTSWLHGHHRDPVHSSSGISRRFLMNRLQLSAKSWEFILLWPTQGERRIILRTGPHFQQGSPSPHTLHGPLLSGFLGSFCIYHHVAQLMSVKYNQHGAGIWLWQLRHHTGYPRPVWGVWVWLPLTEQLNLAADSLSIWGVN